MKILNSSLLIFDASLNIFNILGMCMDSMIHTSPTEIIHVGIMIVVTLKPADLVSTTITRVRIHERRLVHVAKHTGSVEPNVQQSSPLARARWISNSRLSLWYWTWDERLRISGGLWFPHSSFHSLNISIYLIHIDEKGGRQWSIMSQSTWWYIKSKGPPLMKIKEELIEKTIY